MKLSPIIAAVALAVAIPTVAYGQGTQSASMVRSKGHSVGESTVVVPVAGADLGFISNVLYENSSDDTETAAILRVAASFELMSATHNDQQLSVAAPDPEAPSTGAGQTVDFKAGLSLVGTQYLDTRKRVNSQSNLAVAAHADAVVYPHGKTTFYASDNFIRDTRPRDFVDVGSLDRDINHLRLGLRFKPGTGAIRLGIRYENKLDLFESSGLPFADRIQHKLAAKADWQFLPITKFYAEVSAGLYSELGTSDAGKASSIPVRALMGTATAITQKTTVRTHIGFGKGFYSSGQDFMNVLFGAEFGFRYSPVGRFTVGYRYDFYDAVNANFYRDHALSAGLDQQFGRVVLSGRLGARLRGYRGIPMTLGPPSRDDIILSATARGHYMVRDWLAIVGQVNAHTAQTDYMYNANGAPGGPDDPSYSRTEATIGVRAAY